MYIYFAWNGRSSITETEQVTLAVLLGGITVAGSFLFLFSRQLPEDIHDTGVSAWEACVDYIGCVGRMGKKREVILMIPLMAFMGFEMAFFQGIYPTCIGATG